MSDISLWWSFTLMLIGVTGQVLVYRSQSRVGPIVGIAAQGLWIAYGLVTAQWWFILSAFAYGGTNIYGLLKRRTQKEPARG